MSFPTPAGMFWLAALAAFLVAICRLCARLSSTARPTRRRVLLAALIAPLAFPSTIYGFVDTVAALIMGNSEAQALLKSLLVLGPFVFFRSFLFVYVGVLILGAPLFFLLWRFSKLRWTWALGVGLLGGAVSFVPFHGVSSASALQLLFEILTGAVGGAVIALTFWWIAVRGNDELATWRGSGNGGCGAGHDGSGS